MHFGSDPWGQHFLSNAEVETGFVPHGDAGLLDSRPSLLVIAGTEAQPDIDAMARGAGFRVVGMVPPDELAGRLSLTIGIDSLLIDLRGLGAQDTAFAHLAASLLSWPGWFTTRPMLLVDLDMVETVAATLSVDFDRILCEPSLSEIGLELCLLARKEGHGAHLADIGSEGDATRLEELSAEVRRLAETIDRLARQNQTSSPSLHDRIPAYAPPPTLEPTSAGERPDRKGVTREEVGRLLNARRMRDRFLPGDLFADPAWDMMLDLLGARIDGKLVSVSSLCIAAAVPPTTALRWITQLTDRGLFERRNDPDDARRIFISLSDEAAENLSRWFSAVRRTGLRFVS